MCIFAAAAIPAAAGAASAAGAAGTAAATAAGLSAMSAASFGGAAVGGAAASTAATAAATAAAGMTAAQAMMANLAVGMSVASAIGTPLLQYSAQQQQARYQQQLFDYNKTVAEGNAMAQYASLARRQAEEQKKFGQEMGIIARRGAEARATALVSSVESGVSGLSVDSLMNNYYRQQSEYLTTTQQQAKASMFQAEMEKEQARAGYQGQVLSAMPTAPGGSPLALGLGVAGGLSGLYSDIYLNTMDRQTLRSALRI